jgi:hypothetical protein
MRQINSNKPPLQQPSPTERIVSVAQIAYALKIPKPFLRQLLRELYPDHRPHMTWRWKESEAERVKQRVLHALGRDEYGGGR